MKFIACYENTSAGKAAVSLAIEHAKLWNTDIEIVSTITREDAMKYSQLKKIEEQIAKDVHILFEGSNINYSISLLTDNLEAGEQIVTYSKRKKADLIFIGIKGKSRVGKMIFGSNAQFVILNASCPVVTVR